jgi:hypothetical protein
MKIRLGVNRAGVPSDLKKAYLTVSRYNFRLNLMANLLQPLCASKKV